jgi:hypothetical protein
VLSDGTHIPKPKIFWKALDWDMMVYFMAIGNVLCHWEYFMAIGNTLWPFGIFLVIWYIFGHLEYFWSFGTYLVIWYISGHFWSFRHIFSCFGMLYQEKSGNPGLTSTYMSVWNRFRCVQRDPRRGVRDQSLREPGLHFLRASISDKMFSNKSFN